MLGGRSAGPRQRAIGATDAPTCDRARAERVTWRRRRLLLCGEPSAKAGHGTRLLWTNSGRLASRAGGLLVSPQNERVGIAEVRQRDGPTDASENAHSRPGRLATPPVRNIEAGGSADSHDARRRLARSTGLLRRASDGGHVRSVRYDPRSGDAASLGRALVAAARCADAVCTVRLLPPVFR